MGERERRKTRGRGEYILFGSTLACPVGKPSMSMLKTKDWQKICDGPTSKGVGLQGKGMILT